MSYDDVVSVMHEIKPSAVFHSDTDLLNCGLDSLDLASVLPACEIRYGVRIDENQIQWRGIRTVQQFAEALCSHA